MLKVVEAPTIEPISVDDVKAHAIIGHSLDDALLSVLISAARAHGEGITGRRLAPTTLEVIFDAFPSEIRLPGAPITELTSVKYIDVDGVEQALDPSEYEADTEGIKGRIIPVTSWPSISATKLNSVRVQYVAGYTPETIPADIRLWLLVRVATLYSQRETMVVGGQLTELGRNFVDCMLDPFVIPEGL